MGLFRKATLAIALATFAASSAAVSVGAPAAPAPFSLTFEGAHP